MANQVARFQVRALLFVSTCASGIALMMFFLAGWPLGIALGTTLGVATACWVWVWRSVDESTKATVIRRCLVGVAVGIPATIAYDLSRLLLVTVTNSSVQPFAAWPLFGELLGGGPSGTSGAFLVGAAYHGLNGVAFAAAYSIAFADRGIRGGIIWALSLEVLMVSFYPGWLGLKALDEFISVTVVGHVVYGSVVGWGARKYMLPLQKRSKARA